MSKDQDPFVKTKTKAQDLCNKTKTKTFFQVIELRRLEAKAVSSRTTALKLEAFKPSNKKCQCKKYKKTNKKNYVNN